jgi:hypothetical protein
LQKRTARKGNEAQAVRAGLLHQVECSQLGAGEPIGRDVFGQHALGGVNRDDYIQTALFCFLPVKSPLRSRQGDDEADYGEREERNSKPHAARGKTDGQARQETRLDKLSHQGLPLPPGPPEEREQRWWDYQEQPKHL